MSKQFKVGQKVRVTGVVNTRQACGSHDFDVGEERKVTQFDSSDNTYRLEDEGTESWVHADDLEDVAPEFDVSKLKRGDKIQLKEGSVSKYGWKYNGKVAEVDYVYDDGDLCFAFAETPAKIFEASDILGYWPESEPKYSVGDLVEVVDTVDHKFVLGQIGRVLETCSPVEDNGLLVESFVEKEDIFTYQSVNKNQVKPFKRPKTKFKEFQGGDEVVILGNKHTAVEDRYPHPFEVGQVGKVERVFLSGPKGVLVSCGDSEGTVAHKDLHKLQPAAPVVEEPVKPEHKYAVGDTLQVVSKTKQNFWHEVGEKLVVTALTDVYGRTPGLNYLVEGGQVIHEEDLGPVTEPEEPTHKYTVGDVLTVTAAGYHLFAEGTTATVAELTCAEAVYGEALTYRLDNSAGLRQRVSEEHLTPVVEKPEVKPVTLADLEVGKEFMLTCNKGSEPLTKGVKVMILPEPYDRSMTRIPRVLQLNDTGHYGKAVVDAVGLSQLQHLVD